MKIYYANDLFNHATYMYNEWLGKQIRALSPDIDIYIPQENADINDKSAYADAKQIAIADTNKVLASDLMIAILDGQVIDPGVASEVGIAYAKGIKVFGLYTDSRQQGATNQKKLDALQEITENQFSYVNLYTVGLIKLNGQMFNDEKVLLQAISALVK